MASFDYRLNPVFTIKECSSCGAWYNKSCGCSKKGFVDKFVIDSNKTPDLSQQTPNCPKCGNPVEGLYCRQCALIRKKLEEVSQDFQDTSESSNDNPDIVDAPQEPFLCKGRKKKSELRKIKRLKINIGRFSFAIMMTEDLYHCNINRLPIKEPINSLSMGRASLTLFGTEWDKVIKSSVEDMSSNPKVSHRGDDESPYGEGYRLCRCNHLPIDWIVSVEVVENVVKKLVGF
ncbi:hypothetical protein Tco_0344470 [Tanacetum coccineum]